MPRAAQAIIHLDAIIANYLLAQSFAPQSKNIAIIKADAYGHGSVQVALALQAYVPAFGVAIFEEAVILRDAGITKPILVLQGTNDKSEMQYAANNSIWLMVQNERQLQLLIESPLTGVINIWLKLDTGMHRLGFQESDLERVYQQLKYCPWVSDPIVLCSHFSCASAPNEEETVLAVERFQTMTKRIKKIMGQLSVAFSLANSAALLSQPSALLHWNRPGIMLYGISPFDEPDKTSLALQPAMTLQSSVIAIREINTGEGVGYGKNWLATRPSIIATVAIGYADGFPRHATNGTPVYINGQFAPLVGNVSMDMITVDITDCHPIAIGDIVELWGKNINVNEIAQRAGTIGYELVTRVSARIPRVYANG